ncbi:GNAT family N-acetyltransferase [Martelella alba]|uniref:GNAT family N-acetyltransferase n=1 Tax=Martelella alba TaxID=2590451 RepID=A0ABY2SJN0_9HYPH|nr:GNAT family protein [Martelella alba]TKI05688.1 GNAT family N-acetyltransferase [Martelella alba]
MTTADTNRLVQLIPFEERHFATLSTWFNSARDVVQWGGPQLDFPLDPRQLDAMLSECRATPPLRLCWMAEDEAGGLVGHAQLALDWRNGVARIGRVAIAPAMRGKSLAGAMLNQVLARAFAYAAIERTELNVYSWNTPAIRAYRRLGFVHEGVRRSSAKVDDERWDTAMMSILRCEWNSI